MCEWEMRDKREKKKKNYMMGYPLFVDYILLSSMCRITHVQYHNNSYVVIIANNFWFLFFSRSLRVFFFCTCSDLLWLVWLKPWYCLLSANIHIHKKKRSSSNNSNRTQWDRSPNDGNVLNYTKTKLLNESRLFIRITLSLSIYCKTWIYMCRLGDVKQWNCVCLSGS